MTPEDLNRAVRAEAMRYQGHEQQVVEFYEKNKQAKEALGGPILEDRVVDFIVEMAKVTDKPVTIDELMRDPDAEPEEARGRGEAQEEGPGQKEGPGQEERPRPRKRPRTTPRRKRRGEIQGRLRPPRPSKERALWSKLIPAA